MNWLDLQKMAEKAIEENPHSERDSTDDLLYLSIPEPKKHNGYRVRLFGNRGPLAVIINGVRGRLTVYVSSRRLMDFFEGFVIRSEEAVTLKE